MEQRPIKFPLTSCCSSSNSPLHALLLKPDRLGLLQYTYCRTRHYTEAFSFTPPLASQIIKRESAAVVEVHCKLRRDP